MRTYINTYRELQEIHIIYKKKPNANLVIFQLTQNYTNLKKKINI